MHAAQEFTTAVRVVVNCTRKLRSGIWPALLPFSAAPASRSLVQVTVKGPRCIPGVSLGLLSP
jgi:hypothetical protein